nr:MULTISPECIES: transposase [Nocardia]
MLISHSTNLDLARMAAAGGISYDIRAWTARSGTCGRETVRVVNLAIIGYHAGCR